MAVDTDLAGDERKAVFFYSIAGVIGGGSFPQMVGIDTTAIVATVTRKIPVIKDRVLQAVPVCVLVQVCERRNFEFCH